MFPFDGSPTVGLLKLSLFFFYCMLAADPLFGRPTASRIYTRIDLGAINVDKPYTRTRCLVLPGFLNIDVMSFLVRSK